MLSAGRRPASPHERLLVDTGILLSAISQSRCAGPAHFGCTSMSLSSLSWMTTQDSAQTQTESARLFPPRCCPTCCTICSASTYWLLFRAWERAEVQRFNRLFQLAEALTWLGMHNARLSCLSNMGFRFSIPHFVYQNSDCCVAGLLTSTVLLGGTRQQV